ncbi:hypothetical protein TWF696_007948 [Orbilia brochopaga]|uniref:HpcH/HpaI aldolase/citrate lyase domain-containing protein n=1 Tax=Orbilia brochopaga TaxID=3140254 RepID=A0AAV9UN47_9PEZI
MTGRASARLACRFTELVQNTLKNSRAFHTSRELHSAAGKGHSLLRGGRPRRSFFYVPAYKDRYIEKSLGSNADCIVLDLEDGVAQSRKDSARQNIQGLLQRLHREGYKQGENKAAELCVRVNHEGWTEEDAWGDHKSPKAPSDILDKDLDLLALPEAENITIVLPKTNSPEDISRIHKVISAKRHAQRGKASAGGRPQPVIALFETPRAIINVGEFLRSKVRMEAIVFAAEDYCASMGIPRGYDLSNMLFARSAVVNLCKALGITPIDMVCQNIRDQKALEEECLRASYMGFEGKQVVHPDQIDIVNSRFLPLKEEVEHSRKILAAVRENPKKGAFELEGKMLDKPVFRKADDICTIQQKIDEYEANRFVK